MANTIKIKRGLSSNISNIILAQGELAITTDTNELYVGTTNGNVKLNDSNIDEIISIGKIEPTSPSVQLWIENDTLNNIGTEVVNSLDGDETDKAPSIKAVNGAINAINNNINNIIGSGSNNKGIWVKYDDGTMICESLAQNTLTSASQSGYFFVLFPAEYISAPNIICTNSYHYYPDIIWSTGEVTVNGVTLFWQKISGTVGENQTVDCRYITIGRWKA